MQGVQEGTSGVAVLDALIDGVRVGDNLVVTFAEDVPADWLVDRYIAAAGPERLVVADATGRHGQGPQVLDWTAVDPEEARRELAASDERIGTDAAFAVDSLSALARRWEPAAAMDLFLWACPRLFRRRSVALWIVRLAEHDDAFVRQLTAITQVVVACRPAGDDEVQLEAVKADGRGASVTGRSMVARLVAGDLVDARPLDPERKRLGDWLRDLRSARGVGQADLARRVGISPSALSQAERGVRAVSAETLLHICEALGVPLALDDVAGRGYRVHRRGGGRTTTVASGVTGQRRSDDASLVVWDLHFSPRAAGRNPLFVVKASETLLVVRGVLQVELAGTTEVLQEGDTLVADTAAISAWSNPADTPAEVLWVLARPG